MSAAAARRAPSVSPLSTNSKTRSPPTRGTRANTMRDATDAAQRASGGDSGPGAEPADLADDRSSSLSEPEDDEDDEDGQRDGAVEDEEDEDGDESVAQASVENDSEAETERLEATPRKPRRHPSGVGKTPSKLSQTAAVDDELSDPPSPLLPGAGAASSTSTAATAGKKRKRSETVESSLSSADSDLGESPAKRSQIVIGGDAATESEQPADDEGMDTAEETPLREALARTIVKGGRVRKGKQKGRKAKQTVEVPEPEPEPEPELAEEQGNEGAEVSEESSARNEEEVKQQKEASHFFEDVAKQFRSFRDRLYTERLALLNSELHLLSQPNCEHPEYLRQIACVDARLQKQRTEAHAFYTYKMRCIRQRTLGERSQLHSQYFQFIRGLREQILDQLGDDWYSIQQERRKNTQDSDASYMFRLPEKRSDQLRQQAKYNQEISVLSGVARYVGFPAAPEIGGVQGDDLENDLKAMNLSKRATLLAQPPPPVYLPRPANGFTSAHNEKLAHDQFIEQNAWARPQGPILTHGAPGISHTPDWAEPGLHTAKGLARNLATQGIHGIDSLYATPAGQRRGPVELSSAGTLPGNSDGAEAPSSVLAAPPTADRALQQHSTELSPLTMHKQRQPNGGGGGADLPSLRNISGVSGASTIDAVDGPDGDGGRPTPMFHAHPRYLGDEQREAYAAAASQFRPAVFDHGAAALPSASSAGA